MTVLPGFLLGFEETPTNTQPILSSPFSHRRHLLHTLFPPFANPLDPTLARFAHIEALDSTSCTDTPAEIQAFFEHVVEQKCEGLMVKLLESGEGIAGEDEEDGEGEGEGVTGSTPKKRKSAAAIGAGSVAGAGAGAGNTGASGGKKKPLPATYEPDQRSQGWLKVKKGE